MTMQGYKIISNGFNDRYDKAVKNTQIVRLYGKYDYRRCNWNKTDVSLFEIPRENPIRRP